MKQLSVLLNLNKEKEGTSIEKDQISMNPNQSDSPVEDSAESLKLAPQLENIPKTSSSSVSNDFIRKLADEIGKTIR